jgi:hypothetical protein
VSLFVDRPRAAQTRCRTCGQPIRQGGWRIVEEASAVRRFDHEERSWREYEHLACALAFDRDRVKSALISAATDDVTATKAVAELADAKLAADVLDTRAQRATTVDKRTTPLDDPLAVELLAGLDAEPTDRALLGVLGDHLQQRGDERGELIALDLAASSDPTASARRRELAAALTPALAQGDKAIRGIGFIRELHLWIDAPLADRADVLAHPACRLLRTLNVIVRAGARDTALPIAAGCLPRGLRGLRINGGPVIAGDLAWLPFLADLDVQLGGPVHHSTLRTATLREVTRDHVGACAASLPAVTTLHLHNTTADAVAELVTSRWLPRLDALELSGGLDEAMLVDVLRHGLAGRRLASLAIRTSVSRRAYDHLATLCDALDCPCAERKVFAAAARRVVEHATRPEWGRGTLVREANGKVEIRFADAVRTFKADAPFLRWLED